ncbi:uncharacterized protein B0H18DRAFT_1082745 [Fomitopsis serialis]|uniref:uncharacterized protein n=1 Tax=Fomitopsis serialis TaxID=139415 RepID=UPI002007AC0E|nr:uncharacterized protein B0H18DRAFT_1082745 [Neoantrodia serialis]KAH9935034.1 hypothetical protein B0H18DRAFT_1082745 [Neoantrodia serialis]
MYLDGYSAWITVPGHELREFDIAVDQHNRRVTCWIPSEEGAKFSVHWQDHGWSIPTATFIKLDGYTVPGHFLMGTGHAERSNIRVGLTTVRPFMFQRVPELYIGAVPTDTDPKELGTIVVKIKRVAIVGKHSKNAPIVPRPPLGGQRSVGAEDPVGIGYGGEEMGHVQMPTTPGTYATFIFRYRTRTPPTPTTQIRTSISRIPAPLGRTRTMLWVRTPRAPTIPTSPAPTPTIMAWLAPSTRPRSRIPTMGRPPPTTTHRSQTPPKDTRTIRSREQFRPIVLVVHIPVTALSLLTCSSLPTYASSSASRLKTLYSDFSRQKQSNPTSYASNIEWWRRTLEVIVLKGWLAESDSKSTHPDRLVLRASGSTLADNFRYEGVGKPLGLPTVVVCHQPSSPYDAELCTSRTYFPLSDFLNSTKSIYDPGWLPYRIASYVVGKPLWWALNNLTSYSEQWKRVKGDYVLLSLLERAADNVLLRQRSKGALSLADSLFEEHALDGVVLSELDIRVLLRYLERDKKSLVTQGGVIKFIEPDLAEQAEITAVDAGVLELKAAVDKLQAQVDSIQSKISQRAEQITTALRQKRKEIALSHLRAQKQLEALLKQRLGSLDTLHSTLLRVEQSAGDVEIMKSYESSTATLRAILAHPSLQREKVDETMDAMASANADAKEIDDAIHMGTDMAQADLEDEWKALVQEQEREGAEKAEAEQARRRRKRREPNRSDSPQRRCKCHPTNQGRRAKAEHVPIPAERVAEGHTDQ